MGVGEILFLITLVQSAIQIAEKLFTKKSSGLAKKKYVMDQIRQKLAVLRLTGKLPQDLRIMEDDQIMALVSTLIDTGVSAFNVVNSFTKEK